MFAAPVPNFNLRGRTEVRTLIGALTSLIILTFTILYGILKLQIMLLRKRPDLVSYFDEAGSDATTPFNIITSDFMMAFSAANWDNGPRADSRYI